LPDASSGAHAASRSPSVEYERRAAERQLTVTSLDRLDVRYGQLRLLTFASAVLLAWAAWSGALTAWWLLAPAGVFAILARRHDDVLRARTAAAAAVRFYQRGLARIGDAWAGGGATGDRFRSDDHLYANDLDLFGRGSLFELLSIARTPGGEEALAGWLTAPAAPGEIAARQAAVTELTPALDLREALALAGSDVAAGVHTDHLIAWAEAPPHLSAFRLRWLATGLTVLNVAAIAVSLALATYLPLLVVLVVAAVAARPYAQRVGQVLHAAQAPSRDLSVLRQLVQRLERASFTSDKLVALRDRIVPAGTPASVIIRRLERLVEAHDWEHNIFFSPVALVLMWGMQVACAIEIWRARHGAEIGGWLRAAGEIEALSSLSAYRYEHPADPFPVVDPPPADGGGGRLAVYAGAGLGHPLLPADRMVRNDVTLDGTTRLVVVSGSNMSGKSTLLRTVGINAVLAFAGAPVRAGSLRLSPLAIGATLRIQDSLQEGRSRFYAEITRIRQIVDAARGARPLLFLLDEIFHGTNSHDRLVGASNVLRTLIDLGAAGLITTHDLALTGIAGELAPRATNAHFEDRFEGGEIVFDYRMKSGPVTRSNALALMRAVGLEIARE
jgi:hypothetical protein